VVEDVEQGCAHRECGRQPHAACLEGKRKAKPDVDDADVLDRVIGKEALEVMLH